MEIKIIEISTGKIIETLKFETLDGQQIRVEGGMIKIFAPGKIALFCTDAFAMQVIFNDKGEGKWKIKK